LNPLDDWPSPVRRSPIVDQTSAVMTVDELAAYLRVHPSTVYKLLKRKGLPGFRVGSDWRFSVPIIDEWIKEKAAKVTSREKQ
jgi:excisionase family DNA binding protein